MREADLLLFLVHLDDLELVLVADLQVDLLAGVVDRFGDVAEAFDAFGDLDEGAELRGAQDLALDDVADAVLGEERIPDIGLELLDAEREAAVLRLDAEDDCLDLLTLLENFRGVLDALGPAEVGDVDQTVDAVFDLDEGAEVGEVADAAFDDGTDGVLVLELLPGIVLELLHAERDAAVVGVDREDDGVDFVAGLDHLGGVLHPLGPGHFGDVDEAFDALLELDERAVVGDREDAAADLGADRVALDGVEPGVRRELLEAERDALLFLVELEDLDLDLVANVDEVAGVGETAPAHVGDVEQAVEAAHVDECAVVGEVLDDAGEDAALFEGGEGDRLLGVLLFLEDLLAGDDDVAALLVELDDADFDLGADVAVEVADGANLDLRAGQEGLDADVDGETTLDAGDDHALDGGLGVGGLFELVPHLVTQRLLVADEVAALRLLALDHHFDGVADLELGGAVVVEHLLQRNESLGLEADIDHHVLVGDLDDGAGDDDLFGGQRLGGVLLGSLLAVEALERLGKVLGVVLGLAARRRPRRRRRAAAGAGGVIDGSGCWGWRKGRWTPGLRGSGRRW